MPRNALGRGLGALIREPEPKPQAEPTSGQPTATTSGGAVAVPAREVVHSGPQQLDIDLIEPSPYQPRTRFREEALDLRLLNDFVERLVQNQSVIEGSAGRVLGEPDRCGGICLGIAVNKKSRLFSGREAGG